MAAAIRSKNIIDYLERPSRQEKEMVSEMDDRVREWVIEAREALAVSGHYSSRQYLIN